MLDVRELYQEVILDHNRSPRNFHVMDNATQQADGFNPLCGDKIHLYLKISHNIITDISFVGKGCAISTASASLMTECIMGKSLEEAKNIFQQVHPMLTKDSNPDKENKMDQQMGKLAILAGVKAYPARVKCATLAWHTLEAALENKEKVVSTEG